MRVLVVDDDARLAAVLERALTEAGHAVQVTADGPAGLLAATLGDPDVVVLDWMLPGLTGPQVCRELRARGVRTPVLLLTARDSVADRVEGLDALADDFLAKPFSLDELLARLRALVRRGSGLALPVVTVGDLVVDADRRSVRRGGTPVELTAREFDVLLLLAQRAGRLVTRQQILDEVWDGESDLRSNVIDVYIASLRAKVDKPFGVSTIETLRGAGYRLGDGTA
ncbi:MAG: response regulator transcription factor [Mycobacteriales bacterium]